jgi:hypothetical protein
MHQLREIKKKHPSTAVQLRHVDLTPKVSRNRNRERGNVSCPAFFVPLLALGVRSQKSGVRDQEAGGRSQESGVRSQDKGKDYGKDKEGLDTSSLP